MKLPDAKASGPIVILISTIVNRCICSRHNIMGLRTPIFCPNVATEHFGSAVFTA